MTTMTSQAVTEAYREAAQSLYGISPEDAAKAIVPASEDAGEWAPKALVVLYLEHRALASLAYWGRDHMGACHKLEAASGRSDTFIETVNAAVCAVYPC